MVRPLWTASARHHGSGPLCIAWHPSGAFIATSGANKTVNIYDRHGEAVHQLPLQGTCIDLCWDRDGDLLVALQTGSSEALLVDVNARRSTSLDTGLRDPCSCSWSPVSSMLAIGSARGKILLYNKQNLRKVPILGKHTKRIIASAWSHRNELAMSSEDKTLTLSNDQGDTLFQLRGADYTQLSFGRLRSGGGSVGSEENCLACVANRKTLFLVDLALPEEPYEINFNSRYGNIASYRFYGDGYMLLGFSAGFFVVMSTDIDEMGTELFAAQMHRNQLASIAVCESLQLVATMGDNAVKVMHVGEWREVRETILLEDEAGYLDRVSWTPDGQIMSVSTKTGTLHCFVTKMPMRTDSFGSRIGFLSSLLEVTLVDVLDADSALTVAITTEPTLLSVGPDHCAVCMNNQAWIYMAQPDGQVAALGQRTYPGTVEAMKLNSRFIAVLAGGRAQLHALEEDGSQSTVLPNKDSVADATCIALSHDILAVGTAQGRIFIFHCDAFRVVNEYRHTRGVKQVYPNMAGTRILLVDVEHNAFLLNPTSDELIPVPDFQPSTQWVLWDTFDANVFCAVAPEGDSLSATTYIHRQYTLNGPQVASIGVSGLPTGYVPLQLHSGTLSMLTPSSQRFSATLQSHDALSQEELAPRTPAALAQLLALGRFDSAWEVVSHMKGNVAAFDDYSKVTMEALDVQAAIRSFRSRGIAGMVMALEECAQIEETTLLAGSMAMLMGNHALAQELFLRSTQPERALELRCDLLQWDQALHLAKTLAPARVSAIARRYAQQQEFIGEYSEALKLYETGLSGHSDDEDHVRLCNEGIARLTLRLGEVSRGMELVKQSGSRTLLRECGAILEGMRQMHDAASLYVQAGLYDKAAMIYIQTKSFAMAAPLMSRITTPKLHQQYAKAKEADGSYEEAEVAYEVANDIEAVVRLNLQKLANPEKAFALVRSTRNVEGAKQVARFCQSISNPRGAIEFLLLAKDKNAARELAETSSEMETYIQLIGDSGSADDYTQIAKFFESQGSLSRAADFYLRNVQYHRAVKLYLEAGNIEQAIVAVGLARSDILTREVIDRLMGESDVNSQRHVFKLYGALGNWTQASTVAVMVAKQEQELGNYVDARNILLEIYRDLEAASQPVSSEIRRALLLLHSYALAKLLIKHGDHPGAARMLIRVAGSISRFPEHIVPILTSTVLECVRAGLKQSAFEYASLLMRPEYRGRIDEKYKKKVETVVRKTGPDAQDVEDSHSPCPFCSASLPSTSLECRSCQNTLPYCIATGRHMTRDDWSDCPTCGFPALFHPFVRHLEREGVCPM